MPFRIQVGSWFAALVNFLSDNFGAQFDFIRGIILWTVNQLEALLGLLPFWLLSIFIAFLAYRLSGKGMAIFSLLGLFLISGMGLWAAAMQTLALIITATIIALGLGIPLGILAAKSDLLNSILRPLLDFMQTMPAFVYLIPAVFFFRIGVVPAVIATIIFSMPPAVRLTNLGIRQVPAELVEAGRAFGTNWQQLLFKIQLPLALPTILAGINQSIMLSLSMVVIASMIGGGGLGSTVLSGISSLDIGLGFEGGIAVVIIAIILDRLTQGPKRN